MADTKISAFTSASALGGTEILGGVQSSANAGVTIDQIKTYCNTQVLAGIPIPYPKFPPLIMANTTAAAMAAASERRAFIGYLKIAGSPSGTKTISFGGGGRIGFMTNSATFAAAAGATLLDVGIQGVSAAAGPAAQPDGTFTVKKTYTSATDTIGNGAWTRLAMSTGTASLSDGQLIAVVFDMTQRGGADTVTLRLQTGGSSTNIPGCNTFTAAAWAATLTHTPNVVIEFDDGTLGTFSETMPFSTAPGVETWADATNPDERGNIMQIPFNCTVDGMWFWGGITDVNSTFTINLFSTPNGTPTSLLSGAITVDPHKWGTVAIDKFNYIPFSAQVSISKNTDVAIAIRATGTTNLRLLPITVNASGDRFAISNGTTVGKTTRDGGSGAFAAASTTVLYQMGLNISKVISG